MRSRLVSVVIPVFNGERYLGAAIKSVLAQTYGRVEIIVVDDGSTDASGDVAQAFPEVRYIYQNHGGQAIARNRGVAAATGEFLAFLDADDLWLRDKLQCQTDALTENPSLSMVFGHVRQFYDPETAGNTTHAALPQDVPGHLPGAMLIRRAEFLRVGGFDARWKVGEVVDWYARATEALLQERMLDRIVLERRIHDGNLGIRHRDSADNDYVAVVKQALDRRRARGFEP